MQPKESQPNTSASAPKFHALHYNFTAKRFREIYLQRNQIRLMTIDETSLFANLISNFADSFEKDNPRFDRDRFYKACYGIED